MRAQERSKKTGIQVLDRTRDNDVWRKVDSTVKHNNEIFMIRDRLMQWSVSERVAEAEFLTHKLRYGLRGACVSGEFIYYHRE